MTKTILRGILLAMLLASLRGRPGLAQECPQNAANPKSASVIYDLHAGRRREVIFKPGADGVLRAIDAERRELWTFAPPELDAAHRADGLMSDVRVLRFDADLDGSIDSAAGDRVWLFFGMRRGGRHYYALDVTDGARPQVLWRIGPAELPGIGETWSTPTVARVRIAGAAQNGERFVLLLGGGYDEALPSAHRIFMVDAASGQLLWYAGGPGGSENPAAPDLALAQMADPIPARVSALDTDGDGFADRLYAADLGGRIWRFDIWNGRDRSRLVTGGILASLGGAASPAAEDARQFFSAPDVALIQRRAAAYYHLAIGTGNRAQPFDTLVKNRFYSVRDRNPFTKLSQSGYDALMPMVEADFFDVTDSLGSAWVPATALGWKLELRLNGGWAGEKVLAEALTVNGAILFPTYRPLSAAACTGENRVYALNVDHGNPALDLNDDEQVAREDASTGLTQPGIAGEVELSWPRREDDNEGGNAPPPDGEPAPGAVCELGAEALRLCVTTKGLVRTFWQPNSID